MGGRENFCLSEMLAGRWHGKLVEVGGALTFHVVKSALLKIMTQRF
jgi:hypothetical protein